MRRPSWTPATTGSSSSAAIAPIIVDGEAVGAVVVGTTSNVTTVGELEEGLVVTAAGYFARQVG